LGYRAGHRRPARLLAAVLPKRGVGQPPSRRRATRHPVRARCSGPGASTLLRERGPEAFDRSAFRDWETAAGHFVAAPSASRLGSPVPDVRPRLGPTRLPPFRGGSFSAAISAAARRSGDLLRLPSTIIAPIQARASWGDRREQVSNQVRDGVTGSMAPSSGWSVTKITASSGQSSPMLTQLRSS
jgi:hypothetical protein